MRRFPLVFVWLLAIPFIGSGQFYEYGQDAGTLKWSFFDAPHYRLIYPRGLDSVAFTLADRLEYYYPFQSRDLKHQHQRQPVIIHNESSFSNGVVSWAPRRLEVFSNPDPNGYPQDWLTQLVLHEGRHLMQIDKLNQGFTRGLYYIAGEQAVGAVAAYLPRWFLEGDAVDAETRFSFSGRGRLPSFEMESRALMLERKKPYTYAKAILGSYRDHIPDHYQMGYLVVDYARRTYGDQFWPDMITFAARKPYSIDPAYFAFRKYGVKSKNALYREAMNSYLTAWEMQREKTGTDTVFDWKHPVSKAYTSYQFPHFISDSLLFAVKSGMDQIPEFVTLTPGGEEKRIFRPGYLNSGRVSCSGGLLAWDEFVPDLRWSNRNFSVIRLYDLKSGKVRSLGRHTRYYSPALSGSGTSVAAIEQSPDYRFFLVILDTGGRIRLKAPAPENHFIQHPCWMAQDSALVLTLTDEAGEHLYSYSLKTGNWSELYSNGHEDLSWPVVRGNTIWFSSTQSGIDDIYRLDIRNGKFERITRSAAGATQPQLTADGERLVYSGYSAEGYSPQLKNREMFLNQPAEEVGKPPLALLREAKPEESEVIAGETQAPHGSYQPAKYSKLFHLLNIHSWLPAYVDYLNPDFSMNPEHLPVNPGITLVSQNLLSTAVSTAGYEYRGGYHYLHSGVVLKGKFPVFELGLDYGGLPSLQESGSRTPPVLKPDNLNLRVNSYIPFRFNTGRFVTYMQPSASWNYTSQYFFYEQSGTYVRGMHYLSGQFYAGSYLRKGIRDIVPRLGLVVSAQIQSTPFEKEQLGSNSMLAASIYLPGILRHHSLKGSIAWQHQKYDNYFYNNLIALPRGMDRLYAEYLTRYSADYILPLAYPDLSLSFLLYLTRIRGGFWIDYMTGKNIFLSDFSDQRLSSANYLTSGFDLLFDCHPLRVSFEFSLGARVSYLRESGKWRAEFLYSVDLP